MSTYRRPDGRTYRITGSSRNGILTAEYKRGETWRAVINLHSLALLTVRHTGTLPEGYPDSTTRALVLPRLQREALDLTPAHVPPVIAAIAKAARDYPEDAAAFIEAVDRPT